ncbi:MAG: hypothetical protein O3A01_01195 [bacterium]|nr:hypothetical protein [bacterium]
MTQTPPVNTDFRVLLQTDRPLAIMQLEMTNDPAVSDIVDDIIDPNDAQLNLAFLRHLSHLPYFHSLPYIEPRLYHANHTVRKVALRLFSEAPFEHRETATLSLLKSSAVDMKQFALKEVTKNKVQSCLNDVLDLLDENDEALLSSVGLYLQQSDFPDLASMLLDRLTHSKGILAVMLLKTLSNLPGFTRWRKLIPYTQSKNDDVVGAAYFAIGQVGKQRSIPYCLAQLDTVLSDNTVRVIIQYMMKWPSPEVISKFADIALGHPKFRMRLLISGALDDMNELALLRGFLDILDGASPIKRRAFVLKKLGVNRFSRSTELLCDELAFEWRWELRQAALEGLVDLADIDSFDVLFDLLRHSPIREGYLAMAAICRMPLNPLQIQSVTKLVQNGELGDGVIQLLLQRWSKTTYAHEWPNNLHRFLSALLGHTNPYIRVEAARLYAQSQPKTQWAYLLDRYYAEPLGTLRNELIACLNRILQHDISPIIQEMLGNADSDTIHHLQGLLIHMEWDRNTVNREFKSLIKIGANLQAHERPRFYKRLFNSSPNAAKGMIVRGEALGEIAPIFIEEWLHSIFHLHPSAQPSEWKTLLQYLPTAQYQHALHYFIEQRADWAAPSFFKLANTCEDRSIRAIMRQGIRRMLQL